MAIVAYSGYDLPALAPVAAGGEAQRRALRAAVGAAAPWAEASTVQQAEEARLAAPISKARLIVDLYARPMWTAARRRRLVGRGWPELGAAWQHGGHLLALVKLCFRHRAAPLTAAIARLAPGQARPTRAPEGAPHLPSRGRGRAGVKVGGGSRDSARFSDLHREADDQRRVTKEAVHAAHHRTLGAFHVHLDEHRLGRRGQHAVEGHARHLHYIVHYIVHCRVQHCIIRPLAELSLSFGLAVGCREMSDFDRATSQSLTRPCAAQLTPPAAK
eukprot:scaffold16752_cov85-Phaeocystis_antarctica.AAC.4